MICSANTSSSQTPAVLITSASASPPLPSPPLSFSSPYSPFSFFLSPLALLFAFYLLPSSSFLVFAFRSCLLELSVPRFRLFSASLSLSFHLFFYSVFFPFSPFPSLQFTLFSIPSLPFFSLPDSFLSPLSLLPHSPSSNFLL